MEVVAILVRWSQLVANLILLGSCTYLAIAGARKELFSNSWVSRLEKLFPLLACIVLAGLVGILATTTGKATGVESNVWVPAAWIKVVQNTSMGHMWAVRAVSALFLLGAAIFIFLKRERSRWHYVMVAGLASLPLIASIMVSHAGSDENFLFYAPVYAIHILMAGVWFGALPAFLLIIFDRRRCEEKGAQLILNVESLKKFSFIALPVMVAIVLTGLVLTDRMVEDHYHTLVASTYGWALIIKISLLVIILLIAFQARSRWLPSFERVCDSLDSAGIERENKQKNTLLPKLTHKTVRTDNHDYAGDAPGVGVQKLRTWVRIEFVLALLLVLFATILSNSMPAKHVVVENWPYSFRFTIDGTLGAGTWEDPGVQFFLVLGGGLFTAAVGLFLLGIKGGRRSKKYNVVIIALVLGCAAVTLPQFAVDAYPETYRDASVPFDAISISNGAAHFSELCSSCHGPQGRGNGILAKTLPKMPADLLTDLYTTKHTAGDFFHWISYGIKEAGMPGFSESLEEEDRWDTVNYIQAMSSGYQLRWLGPTIVSHKLSTMPPDFQFTTYADAIGTLKEYRHNKNVLLTFFSWPDSLKRLEELSKRHGKFKNLNTVILAVPLNKYSETAIADFAANNSLEVVRDGWLEIKNSYILYRRTLKYPDILGKGNIPDHMEFLVDRFGYLRARWIPSMDQSGWDNLALLTDQLQQLNQEKEILSQPHSYAH
ncbi:cytochrome C [Nitrosomonas sp. HPC101]|uniref:CopD family protein n=1 Tax=Nitrosomonas sp. HPC101 TaxID=1658667 RepID=UPI001371ECC1|nr:CopD family protein [Nitrosomonas sp. HPC101]MXS86103.1 cytochrome C [Nitrosomonas sp. HPC101]